MAEQIISASGTQYGAIVTDKGRLLVDMSGLSLFIGSVSASVDSIYVQSGVVNIDETTPIDPYKNNPAWKFEYDADGNLGSITQFIGVGSYVNVFTWSNGSVLINIGSWS